MVGYLKELVRSDWSKIDVAPKIPKVNDDGLVCLGEFSALGLNVYTSGVAYDRYISDLTLLQANYERAFQIGCVYPGAALGHFSKTKTHFLDKESDEFFKSCLDELLTKYALELEEYCRAKKALIQLHGPPKCSVTFHPHEIVDEQEKPDAQEGKVTKKGKKENGKNGSGADADKIVDEQEKPNGLQTQNIKVTKNGKNGQKQRGRNRRGGKKKYVAKSTPHKVDESVGVSEASTSSKVVSDVDTSSKVVSEASTSSNVVLATEVVSSLGKLTLDETKNGPENELTKAQNGVSKEGVDQGAKKERIDEDQPKVEKRWRRAALVAPTGVNPNRNRDNTNREGPEANKKVKAKKVRSNKKPNTTRQGKNITVKQGRNAMKNKNVGGSNHYLDPHYLPPVYGGKERTVTKHTAAEHPVAKNPVAKDAVAKDTVAKDAVETVDATDYDSASDSASSVDNGLCVP